MKAEAVCTRSYTLHWVRCLGTFQQHSLLKPVAMKWRLVSHNVRDWIKKHQPHIICWALAKFSASRFFVRQSSTCLSVFDFSVSMVSQQCHEGSLQLSDDRSETSPSKSLVLSSGSVLTNGVNDVLPSCFLMTKLPVWGDMTVVEAMFLVTDSQVMTPLVAASTESSSFPSSDPGWDPSSNSWLLSWRLLRSNSFIDLVILSSLSVSLMDGLEASWKSSTTKACLVNVELDSLASAPSGSDPKGFPSPLKGAGFELQSSSPVVTKTLLINPVGVSLCQLFFLLWSTWILRKAVASFSAVDSQLNFSSSSSKDVMCVNSL